MVRQAEKLSKEVPTTEFLVVLSFKGGIKFTGTGSLLDHFKNGEPLTDVKPRGVSYTKDTQNDVVDCFEPPPCIEVSTREGSTARYPDTELSDLYQNVRRQLIPEQMEPPTQNANVEPEGCSDQATSHKRARQVTHAANTLEEEQPRSAATMTTRKKGPHQGTAPQENRLTTSVPSLQAGTCVYVAVPTSLNCTVPFVAEVTQSQPLNVKYLHPSKTRGSWHFPDKEDTGAVNTDDIITVLAAPQTRISGSRF
ncbi:uncharacterized protein LOC124267522 [Haliotis rubra]|uniref:uncharacterized protein LOC124267522 n=1 Tax=Haliotis rubra TaxID=36100 RepID=UPI001EE6239B|nr:uncharacterized protein LOC124267522 [Haliotis rubra]